MGMTCISSPMRAPSQDILEALSSAESIYMSGLSTFYEQSTSMHMRDSAMSLALIKAFQTALGASSNDGPAMAAHLVGEIIRHY